MQYAQNTAARLVTKSFKFDHITPILIKLHWLSIKQRITFKMIILTFKSIHNVAPAYISESIVFIYRCSESCQSTLGKAAQSLAPINLFQFLLPQLIFRHLYTNKSIIQVNQIYFFIQHKYNIIQHIWRENN